MYNRYTCPLQPCRHLTLKLLIQGRPRSAKITHIADFKSAEISLIDPRGLQCAFFLRLGMTISYTKTAKKCTCVTFLLAVYVNILWM